RYVFISVVISGIGHAIPHNVCRIFAGWLMLSCRLSVALPQHRLTQAGVVFRRPGNTRQCDHMASCYSFPLRLPLVSLVLRAPAVSSIQTYREKVPQRLSGSYMSTSCRRGNAFHLLCFSLSRTLGY